MSTSGRRVAITATRKNALRVRGGWRSDGQAPGIVSRRRDEHGLERRSPNEPGRSCTPRRADWGRSVPVLDRGDGLARKHRVGRRDRPELQRAGGQQPRSPAVHDARLRAISSWQGPRQNAGDERDTASGGPTSPVVCSPVQRTGHSRRARSDNDRRTRPPMSSAVRVHEQVRDSVGDAQARRDAGDRVAACQERDIATFTG